MVSALYGGNPDSLFDGHRKVVHCDEIFDVIKSIHEKSTGYSGICKTYEIASNHLYVAMYYAMHIAVWQLL